MKNSLDDARTSKNDTEWLQSSVFNRKCAASLHNCLKDLQQSLYCLQIDCDQAEKENILKTHYMLQRIRNGK